MFSFIKLATINPSLNTKCLSDDLNLWYSSMSAVVISQYVCFEYGPVIKTLLK